jgi:hypothetical protein
LNKNRLIFKEELKDYPDWKLGRGKNSNKIKNKIWIHNIELNKNRLIFKEELKDYLILNWKKGRKSRLQKYVCIICGITVEKERIKKTCDNIICIKKLRSICQKKVKND